MPRRTLLAVMALFLIVLPASAAVAQDMGPMGSGQAVAMSMNPVGDSGVSGKAWVAPLDGERVVVTVVLWGFEPGSSHANHIHSASCATGPVVYPLTTLAANDAGWATASTVVNTTMETIGTGHSIQAHAAGGERIVCGDIAPGMMMEPMMMDPMMMPGM